MEWGAGSMAVRPLLLLGFILLLLIAGIWDMAERRIPNRLVLLVALLAPLHHYAVGGWAQLVPAWSGLLAFVLLAAVLLWLFDNGLIGGGDVKLLLASQLFLGSGAAPTFLLAVALAGGILSLTFLLARPLAQLASRLAVRWRIRPADDRLPYGIAIAGGAFATLGGWLSGF